MKNTASKIGEKAKSSTIGKLIGRIIDEENWTPEKVIVLITIALLPGGFLIVGSYFGIKEYLRRRRETNEQS